MSETTAPAAGDVVAALEVVHAALDEVAVLDGSGHQSGWLSVDGLEGAELEQAGGVRRPAGGAGAGPEAACRHRCRAGVCGGGVGGYQSTAAWAARAAGKNRSWSWTPLWLAELLEQKYHHTRGALGDRQDHRGPRGDHRPGGGVSARGASNPGELAECEAKLVHKAASMPPKNLRRAAKRLLDPISERLADQHEAELLEKEEDHAEREAFLSMGDRGDGTWVGKFCLPEMHARLLLAVIDHLGSPRRLQPPGRWPVGRRPDRAADRTARGPRAGVL